MLTALTTNRLQRVTVWGCCLADASAEVSTRYHHWQHQEPTHDNARDRGRRRRSGSVRLSPKQVWNHDALLPNWLMETWASPLLRTYTVCKHVAIKERRCTIAGLLCFCGFVLTASMFYLPRPCFPWCLYCWSETRTDSDFKWCFEINVLNSCCKVGKTCSLTAQAHAIVVCLSVWC